MSATKIEWCDYTINPVVGCTKCSPGCDNCYAEKMAYRLSKMPATAAKYAGIVDKNGWTGKISDLDLSVFSKLPKKPQRGFVGSMTDIFQASISGEYIHKIFEMFYHFPQHTFLLLTKRPQSMADYYEIFMHYLPENVWIGVTVCNQEEADEKIPLLLDIPAALRFISFEPLLGPVNLWRWFPEGACKKPAHESGRKFIKNAEYENGIHWVICGPETGPKKRSFDLEWARSLRNQCQQARVPFFFKKNPNGGRLLDGVEYSQLPEA